MKTYRLICDIHDLCACGFKAHIFIKNINYETHNSLHIIHCTTFNINPMEQIEKPLKQTRSKEEFDQQKTI